MTSTQTIFAGVDISSGRKPITFAALDEELNVKILEKWDSSQLLVCLQEYENRSLAVNVTTSKSAQSMYADLTRKFSQLDFNASSKKSRAKQWLETDAQECFRALSGHHLLPRRSLEGRLQRSAILYEQGVQIADPVDMFEEITRYKLVQGILPLENLPTPNEQDALVTAYLAWISANRPRQIVQKAGLALPEPG